MALATRKGTPHPAIELFIKMFVTCNKDEAYSYFEQAMNSIYGAKATPTRLLDQFDWAYELVGIFSPKKEPEMHLCAQYILCHIIGMHKINQPCYLDQRIAIKFIKLSHITLERLQKKLIGNPIIGNSKKGIRYGNKTMRGKSQKEQSCPMPKIPSKRRERQVQTS